MTSHGRPSAPDTLDPFEREEGGLEPPAVRRVRFPPDREGVPRLPEPPPLVRRGPGRVLEGGLGLLRSGPRGAGALGPGGTPPAGREVVPRSRAELLREPPPPPREPPGARLRGGGRGIPRGDDVR